jgi:hypothetical protein
MRQPSPESPGPVPEEGALWGALVPDTEHYGWTPQTAQEAFEEQVQRPDTLERVYYQWDEGWPTVWDYWSRDHRHQLLVSWSARRRDGSFASWADIAAGLYDADIDRVAAGIQRFSLPIFFVFHHEPENDADIGGPADFVAAYQHVHDRFGADGVTNVSYVVVLMAYTFRIGEQDEWYPGDEYVDYLGADGYNWYLCEGRDDPWTEFDWIFQQFYDYGVAHGKEMVVAEYGTGEDPADPDRKANWFINATATLKGWPEVKGVAYFNNGNSDPSCDRWIDSSPQSLDAFIDMGADRYFKPPLPPSPAVSYEAYVGAIDDDYEGPAGDLSMGVSVGFLNNGPFDSHTFTDNSGMGWFDSDEIPVNATWQWTYPAAGNYKMVCTLHPEMILTVKIPMAVVPTNGHLQTRFRVTWSSSPPADGMAFDVQVQRPGGAWETWQKQVTKQSGTFLPDGGLGTYSFRARMRLIDGPSSSYSAPMTITVT